MLFYKPTKRKPSIKVPWFILFNLAIIFYVESSFRFCWNCECKFVLTLIADVIGGDQINYMPSTLNGSLDSSLFKSEAASQSPQKAPEMNGLLFANHRLLFDLPNVSITP